MRIIFAYYTHKPGGFCKRLYRLMNALSERGHDIVYCCLDRPPSALRDAIVWRRLWHPMARRSGGLFWLIFCALLPWQLMWAGRAHSIQRFVAFNPFYAVAMWPAKVICRQEIFLFVRLSLRAAGTWPERIFNRLGIFLADTIVCMSESMKAEVESFLRHPGKKRLLLLPNEVAIKGQGKEQQPDECLQCLAGGYLVKRKNMQFLLDVFKLLQERFGQESPQLRIVGDGPACARLKERAELAGLKNVYFLGWKDDLGPEFNVAHLLLHPSLGEGSPNIVLEALAEGLAVLASDIPEHREILRSQDLLFGLESVEALANTIGDISKDRQKLSYIQGVSAQVGKVLQFNWDELAVSFVENR